MNDRLDADLRLLARAARAEIEAQIDVDAVLAGLDRNAGVAPVTTRAAPAPPGRLRRPTVWLGVAAAATTALAGGVWLLGTRDDTIRSADPSTATTLSPTPSTGPNATVPSTAPPASAPPTTGVGAGSDACTGVPADLAGAESIVAAVVAARTAGDPPSVAGCLEAVPPVFDGSPSRCWACAGLTFADVPLRAFDDGAGGITVDLAVSIPDDAATTEIVDTVETWRFRVDGDRLHLSDVTFTEPLVTRADSLATITAYLDAIAASDWATAARMLDDGAISPEERSDLQRLGIDDYSYDGIASGLAAWCATGCATTSPTAADLRFNGFTHDLVRDGEQIRVAWYEGTLSISGLPARSDVDREGREPDRVEWRTLAYEATGISAACVRASLNCTQVVHSPDGTAVSLDPTTRELIRHSVPPVSTVLPAAYGEAPWLYHAGPAGVVYLQVAPVSQDGDEIAADLVAISLASGDGGREIARWSGVTDRVGDTDLVATADGLVQVGCCGPDPVRPAPDAPVLVPWVDLDGDSVPPLNATMRATIELPSVTIARTDTTTGGTREWKVEPANDWLPRGMPTVVPTFDGGFVAAFPGTTGTAIVRGWPDGVLDQIVLTDAPPVSLDRNGRLVAIDTTTARVVRIEPFADRTARPGQEPVVDVAAGTVTITGLEELRAPWVFDPVAFGDAVRGPIAPNEQRTIDAVRRSDTEWVVTVTTSNFFDDSVFADRWELTLERGDDGRFDAAAGTWSNSCQPGRGHQDFSNELCV